MSRSLKRIQSIKCGTIPKYWARMRVRGTCSLYSSNLHACFPRYPNTQLTSEKRYLCIVVHRNLKWNGLPGDKKYDTSKQGLNLFFSPEYSTRNVVTVFCGDYLSSYEQQAGEAMRLERSLVSATTPYRIIWRELLLCTVCMRSDKRQTLRRPPGLFPWDRSDPSRRRKVFFF